jgi:hypothetical protein
MDKALRQPTTPTKHAQTQTSIIKQAIANTTLVLTRVTPNDYEIQMGSACPRETPRLNPTLWRWQTRCLCQMHRGHWPDPLPSSGTLGWWHQSSAAGCRETRSHAERPVDECSAPSPHPGGAPSPSRGYPSSPHWP